MVKSYTLYDMKRVDVNTMSQDTPKIIEISEKEAQKILEQDPEKAKIELEIKKFNRESELLKIQHQPFNLALRILQSPWSTIFGIILSFLITRGFTYQEIKNTKEQAERDRQKDIYDILLDDRGSIYHENSKKCESFFHVSSAVFEGGEKIGNKNFSQMIDKLIFSIPHDDCKKVAKNFATKTSINELDQKSNKELEEAVQEIIDKDKKDIIDKDIQDLVTKLNGNQRKQASAALIQLSKTEKKQQVVNALINGIAGLNEYRKNLYVAYILGKIDNWDKNKEQFNKICNLRNSPYYEGNKSSDQTFTKRVNQAIERSQRKPCGS